MSACDASLNVPEWYLALLGIRSGQPSFVIRYIIHKSLQVLLFIIGGGGGVCMYVCFLYVRACVEGSSCWETFLYTSLTLELVVSATQISQQALCICLCSCLKARVTGMHHHAQLYVGAWIWTQILCLQNGHFIP